MSASQPICLSSEDEPDDADVAARPSMALPDRSHKRRAEASVATPSSLDDAEGGEELDSAQFSDDGDADDQYANVTIGEDFDFSGCIRARSVDAQCSICGQPLELSWNDELQNLVFIHAVRARNAVYHTRCLLEARGPDEDLRSHMRHTK